MIEWPADGSPASIEDLIAPIYAAITFAYELQRRNVDQDIPWAGPPIGEDERANALAAHDQLRAWSLDYSLNDQGRDALTEIIGLALRIGIEQGRRIFKTSSEYQTLLTVAEVADVLKDEVKSWRAAHPTHDWNGLPIDPRAKGN